MQSDGTVFRNENSNKDEKFLYFNGIFFILISISVKCIIWQILNEIVENQD